jgi:hypothetical protein
MTLEQALPIVAAVFLLIGLVLIALGTNADKGREQIYRTGLACLLGASISIILFGCL